MLELTRQEKSVLLALSLVLFTGAVLNFVFKKYPRLNYRIDIIQEGLSTDQVDLNTASLEQLLNIPYVGVKRAQSIMDYRRLQGAFKDVDEIKKIHGIGPKTYQKMVPFIKVGL